MQREKALLIRIALILLLGVIFIVNLIEFVFRLGEINVARGTILAFDILQTAVYIAFLIEGIGRFLSLRNEYGKDALREYWQLYKADCVYFVLCPIVLIFAFIFGSMTAAVEIALWVMFFVKLTAVSGSFHKNDERRARIKKSPYSKKENAVRFSVLGVFLITFVINVVKLVYNAFPQELLLSFDLLQTAAYIFFTVEFILRLRGYYKKYQKSFFREYWKFNKAETVYTIVSPVFLILSFVFGSNNNWLEIMMWVIFFMKMPNVTRRLNDENVFNVVAKGCMLLLICVFVVPLLNLIAMSFSSSPSEIGGQIVNLFPIKFNLYPIEYILQRADYWRSLAVSIMVTLSGTVLSVLLMTLCAYPLSKPKMPFKKGVLVYFLICMMFSGGMAPKILWMSALGLTGSPLALILPSLINVFNLLLIKGFFEGLPAELEESAKLDGANNYQILFSIVVPMALPMIVTVSMFTAISYWNNFYNALMYLTESKTWHPIPMYIKNFFSLSQKDLTYSDTKAADYLENIKMALILASIIPIAIVYPFTLKFFTKGVAVGSVKG